MQTDRFGKWNGIFFVVSFTGTRKPPVIADEPESMKFFPVRNDGFFHVFSGAASKVSRITFMNK